jgi:hypothetical protein
MKFDQCIDRFVELSIKLEVAPLQIGTNCTSQRFEIHLACKGADGSCLVSL